MLDSLVRVSRRVGWGADRLPRDPERPREIRSSSPNAVGEHCKQFTPVERPTRERGPRRGHVPRSESAAVSVRPKRCRRSESYLDRTVYRRSRTRPGKGPEEKAPDDDRELASPCTSIGLNALRPNDRLNSTGKIAVPSVYL